MKKLNVLLNILPFFAWMLLFYLQFNTDVSDLNMVAIYMLLIFPIMFSVYNYQTSKFKKELLIYNSIFALSHIAGYVIHGALWYKLVSSDSETAYITVVLSRESLIYIFVITLIMYFIKRHKEKKAK